MGIRARKGLRLVDIPDPYDKFMTMTMAMTMSSVHVISWHHTCSLCVVIKIYAQLYITGIHFLKSFSIENMNY